MSCRVTGYQMPKGVEHVSAPILFAGIVPVTGYQMPKGVEHRMPRFPSRRIRR